MKIDEASYSNLKKITVRFTGVYLVCFVACMIGAIYAPGKSGYATLTLFGFVTLMIGGCGYYIFVGLKLLKIIRKEWRQNNILRNFIIVIYTFIPLLISLAFLFVYIRHVILLMDD